MAMKTKRDYYREVLEKKDILINELVEEFGEEERPLLENRFAKIKWLFFIGIPNLQREINQKYSENAASITLDFIKNFMGFDDVYIDDSFYETSGMVVNSKTRSALNKIYGKNLITFDIAYGNIQDGVTGIWAFNPNIDMEKIKIYGEHRGKNAKEMLDSLKCSFLRFLKKYPEKYTDEQIIQDSNYQHYCEYCSSGIQKYIGLMEENKKCVSEELELYNHIIKNKSIIYINAFKSILRNSLYPYLSSNDQKIVDSNEDFLLEDVSMMHQIFYCNQELAQESKVESMTDEELQELINSSDNQFTQDIDVRKIIKLAREEANKKAIMDYNKLVIFNGNINLSEENIDLDLSKLDGSMISIFSHDDGKETGRFIVFDPYASPDENYDVHLRHELRHSLTSSISKDSNGIVIAKIGNNLFYYLDDNLIGCENANFNEYFTQKRALENTKKAYENGIYILTTPGVKSPTPITSSYDEYIPKFNKVYERLSKKAKRSQIELTNDNLYKEISAISIKELEDRISRKEELDEETLRQLICNNNQTNSLL